MNAYHITTKRLFQVSYPVPWGGERPFQVAMAHAFVPRSPASAWMSMKPRLARIAFEALPRHQAGRPPPP